MMGFSELFGKLRRREQSQRAMAKARYLEMVTAVAAGKAFDADEAAELLANADRTAAQFESDVRTAAKRKELRARIERAEAARPKLRELDARAQQIEAELKAAQEKFQRDVELLGDERRPLEMAVGMAQGALKQLVDSCPNEELLREFNDVCRAAAELGDVVRRDREALLDNQLHHDGLRLARKVKEKIEIERAMAKNGWEERVRRLTEIAADPEQHLRSQRLPPLQEAITQLSRLEQRRAEIERAILEA